MLLVRLSSYYVWHRYRSFLLLILNNRYPIKRSPSIPICRDCTNSSNPSIDFFGWLESLATTHILEDHLMDFLCWLVVLLYLFSNSCSTFHYGLVFIIVLKCTIRLRLYYRCPPLRNFDSSVKSGGGLWAWFRLLMLNISIKNTYDAIPSLNYLSIVIFKLSLYTLNGILLFIGDLKRCCSFVQVVSSLHLLRLLQWLEPLYWQPLLIRFNISNFNEPRSELLSPRSFILPWALIIIELI